MAWVPTDVIFFDSNGMDGWFQQTYKLVGTLTLAGQPIALGAMMQWAALVISYSQQQKPSIIFYGTGFFNIEPSRCMIAEAANGTSVEDTYAAVLFTRYMDNTYLGFCNVPANFLPAV